MFFLFCFFFVIPAKAGIQFFFFLFFLLFTSSVGYSLLDIGYSVLARHHILVHSVGWHWLLVIGALVIFFVIRNSSLIPHSDFEIRHLLFSPIAYCLLPIPLFSY